MLYILMGVSGSGKSTIGKLLADKMNFNFYDGDDFHPESNVKKMSTGIPLTDEDRLPWLETMRSKFELWLQAGSAVLACSALKEHHRVVLSGTNVDVQWIYLKGDYSVISHRMKMRENHFMKPSMLKSQFDSLEVPSYGWHIDISQIEEECVNQIVGLIDESRIEN